MKKYKNDILSISLAIMFCLATYKSRFVFDGVLSIVAGVLLYMFLQASFALDKILQENYKLRRLLINKIVKKHNNMLRKLGESK